MLLRRHKQQYASVSRQHNTVGGRVTSALNVTKAEETEPLPFSDVPQEEAKQYTKTEINRLSTAELKDLAKENGIDNAEELTGGELKKLLIDKFNL